MIKNLDVYKEFFSLQKAEFTLITHADALVADVYRITLPCSKKFILKVCPRSSDYLREVYYLQELAKQIKIPRSIGHYAPQNEENGAILMEYLNGSLLDLSNCSLSIIEECGQELARIHLFRKRLYGDIAIPSKQSKEPLPQFLAKFEENFAECCHHLPHQLLIACQKFCYTNLSVFNHVDGPCIVHRDYRPGNIIVHENKLQGIIDWSSARAGFSEEDFCSLDQCEWFSHVETKQAFMNGYAKIRAVPDYARIVPLLRISKSLAIIGFTLKQGTWNNKNAHLYRIYRQFLENFFSH